MEGELLLPFRELLLPFRVAFGATANELSHFPKNAHKRLTWVCLFEKVMVGCRSWLEDVCEKYVDWHQLLLFLVCLTAPEYSHP
jgi:hypothetical protein